MKKEIRKIKVMDDLVIGYFNKDVIAMSIQEFLVEITSHEVFSKAHEVD